MTKLQILKEVKKAQNIVDQLVPGKVRVAAHKHGEGGMCMVGYYDMYVNMGGKANAVGCSKMEKLDRYYDVGVFTNLFKQRAEFMNATPEVQMDFEGHPNMFTK